MRHVKFLATLIDEPAFLNASPTAIRAWLRLLKAATVNETPVLPDLRTDRAWLSYAGVTKVAVQAAVDAGLVVVEAEGGHRVSGFDQSGMHEVIRLRNLHKATPKDSDSVGLDGSHEGS